MYLVGRNDEHPLTSGKQSGSGSSLVFLGCSSCATRVLSSLKNTLHEHSWKTKKHSFNIGIIFLVFLCEEEELMPRVY